MAHLVPVKTHASIPGSQSLQDQTSSALGEGLASGPSPRHEMPRQNSDPTSDNPTAPLPAPTAAAASREDKEKERERDGERDRDRDRERDRDRAAWLRDDDMPPKVLSFLVASQYQVLLFHPSANCSVSVLVISPGTRLICD